MLRNGRQNRLEDLDVDRKIILKLMQKGGRVWTGFIWLRSEPVAGSCKHSNESSGAIEGREFIDRLSD
jgi:hypothetical protein